MATANARRNGTTRIRRATIDDAGRLARLFDRLGPETIQRRFFALRRGWPPEVLDSLAGGGHRLAVVAEENGEIVGLAECIGAVGETAEIAVLVEDRCQGRGLGRALLQSVLAAANAAGMRRFVGYVLCGNVAMVRLLERATRILRRRTSDGVDVITFTTRARARLRAVRAALL
jgi:ribosomal protein S18 acetylase RimI-like enzyme